jgi:hypothetical protein
VLRCLKDLVETQMIKFPGEHKIRRYHADGGKELIDQRIVSYIEGAGGTVTYSSTDTPELNGIADRSRGNDFNHADSLRDTPKVSGGKLMSRLVTFCFVCRLIRTRDMCHL